jgi:ABC-type multidrug transport system fused ATPase/permease subunit
MNFTLTSGRIIFAEQLRFGRPWRQRLVIEDGPTTERGRHDALVSAGGTYTRFCSDGCASAARFSKIAVGLRRSNRF